MNETSANEKRQDFIFQKMGENISETNDNSTNQSLVVYKDSIKAKKTLRFNSPLDYIDLKYIKHSSNALNSNNNNNSNKTKARALSQLGSEKSYKSSTERSLNSSLMLKNPYNGINSTPRTLADAFKTVTSRPQLKVEYINIVSDASLIPKYLSGTVKLESLKRDGCNRNFEKTTHEPIKANEKKEHLPIVRRSATLVRKPSAVKVIQAESEISPEAKIIYYIKQLESKEMNKKTLSSIEENSQTTIDLRSINSIHRISSGKDENDYQLLKKAQDTDDYQETKHKKQNENFKSLNPSGINKEDSFLNYNFSIQRTVSEYETFKAIKKRVKFFEKVDYYDYANTKRGQTQNSDEKEPELNKLSLSVPQYYKYNIANNTNRHFCYDLTNKKKKKEKKSKRNNETILEKSEENIKDAVSETSDDPPLLDSYREIINKSIERNKKIQQKKEEEEKLKLVSNENKPLVKYKHILDKLVDSEKEIKVKREQLKQTGKIKKTSELDIKTDEEEELAIYDAKLSFSENWLIKWSILKNVTSKNLIEIFKKNDNEKRGYLIGESLRTAIQMTCSMTNLKLSYLYSVLSLCGIEGANLKIFNIIISLALKVNHLDDEWFKNLLPQLDLSSVENKVFKALNLWKYLVNPKTKTFSIYELMIEFEAGCVSREHIEFAKKAFANKLYFDVTDYLTYIPLFLYIHDRIIKNPFYIASKNDEI